MTRQCSVHTRTGRRCSRPGGWLVDRSPTEWMCRQHALLHARRGRYTQIRHLDTHQVVRLRDLRVNLGGRRRIDLTPLTDEPAIIRALDAARDSTSLHRARMAIIALIPAGLFPFSIDLRAALGRAHNRLGVS